MPPLPDDRLNPDADADTSRAYVVAHDERAVHVDKMSDSQLKQLYNAALVLRGMSLLSGTEGWSHDELVNAIVDLEYPDAGLARDVWYRHTQMPALGEE
jgi:hypothetical protein